MSNEPNPGDPFRSNGATLDFILLSLKEHERKLDELIEKLNNIKPQTDSKKELYSRLEKLDCNVSYLERDIKQLRNRLQLR
jgi:uncharacterized coiled-coil protein SlyX